MHPRAAAPSIIRMHPPKRGFIPAAGVDWLLPLYDPLLRLFGRDALLRPGGTLHLLDFGEADSGLHGLIAYLFHRGEEIEGHLEGRIPSLMRDAGFADVAEVSRHGSIFGSMSYYRAHRAADDESESTPG